MNPLTWLPLRDWGYIALVLAVAALGALFVHHERELGAASAKAQLEHERAAVAQVAASAAIASAAESKRLADNMKETVNVTQQIVARMSADAAAGAADRRAFGVQLDAYVRANTRPSDPAPTARGQAATDPLVVLAQLQRWTDERADALAELADKRGAAGAGCQLAYPVK